MSFWSSLCLIDDDAMAAKYGAEYNLREGKVWLSFRLTGVFVGIASLVLELVCIILHEWIYSSALELGLWKACRLGTENCSDVQQADWQRAIIALVIISALFNLLANILATIGLFTSPLPRKLYFYHSAAESYLTAGVACALGLVIYTVTAKAQLESDPVYAIAKGDLSFGFAFVLCWCSAAFLFISSVMMALDSFSHYFTCRSRNKGIPLSNIYCNPANATTSELAGMTDETTA